MVESMKMSEPCRSCAALSAQLERAQRKAREALRYLPPVARGDRVNIDRAEYEAARAAITCAAGAGKERKDG